MTKIQIIPILADPKETLSNEIYKVGNSEEPTYLPARVTVANCRSSYTTVCGIVIY